MLRSAFKVQAILNLPRFCFALSSLISTNPIHGDNYNVTLSKVNVFYGLVYVTALPKLLQVCS